MEPRFRAVSLLCGSLTLDLAGSTVVTPVRGARLDLDEKKASDSWLEPSQVSFQRQPTPTTLIRCEVVQMAHGGVAAATISIYFYDFSAHRYLAPVLILRF